MTTGNPAGAVPGHHVPPHHRQRHDERPEAAHAEVQRHEGEGQRQPQLHREAEVHRGIIAQQPARRAPALLWQGGTEGFLSSSLWTGRLVVKFLYMPVYALL